MWWMVSAPGGVTPPLLDIIVYMRLNSDTFVIEGGASPLLSLCNGYETNPSKSDQSREVPKAPRQRAWCFYIDKARLFWPYV